MPCVCCDPYAMHVEAYNEELRHQCEVKMLIEMKRKHGRAAVLEYLDNKHVKKRRERLAADLNKTLQIRHRKPKYMPADNLPW